MAANGLPILTCATAAFVAVVISLGNGWSGFDSTRGQAMACLLNSATLLALLWTFPPTLDWWRRAGPVLGCAFAALAWGIVATIVVSSGLPDYSAGKIAAYLSGLAALLCGAILSPRRRGNGVALDMLLFVNAAFLMIGLLWRQSVAMQAAGWMLDRDGRFAGLIGNPNTTAAMAAAFAMLAFFRLAASLQGEAQSLNRDRDRLKALIYLPIFFLTMGCVVATASRTTAFILVGTLAVALLERLTRGRRLRMSNERITTAVVIGLVVVVLALLGSTLRERLDSLSAGGADRVATWSHLLSVAGQSPLFGYGLGSFPMVNEHYLSTPRFAQANWTLNSPHDVVLQWVLQAGLPYAALLLAASILAVRQVLKAALPKYAPQAHERWVIPAMLLQILVVSLVDVPLDMPGPVSVTLFLAGLLWGQVLERPEIGILFASGEEPKHEHAIGRRLSSEA